MVVRGEREDQLLGVLPAIPRLRKGARAIDANEESGRDRTRAGANASSSDLWQSSEWESALSKPCGREMAAATPKAAIDHSAPNTVFPALIRRGATPGQVDVIEYAVQ